MASCEGSSKTCFIAKIPNISLVFIAHELSAIQASPFLAWEREAGYDNLGDFQRPH
jgi:hypothetical protein